MTQETKSPPDRYSMVAGQGVIKMEKHPKGEFVKVEDVEKLASDPAKILELEVLLKDSQEKHEALFKQVQGLSETVVEKYNDLLKKIEGDKPPEYSEPAQKADTSLLSSGDYPTNIKVKPEALEERRSQIPEVEAMRRILGGESVRSVIKEFGWEIKPASKKGEFMKRVDPNEPAPEHLKGTRLLDMLMNRTGFNNKLRAMKGVWHFTLTDFCHKTDVSHPTAAKIFDSKHFVPRKYATIINISENYNVPLNLLVTEEDFEKEMDLTNWAD